jgi:hypothetical protein
MKEDEIKRREGQKLHEYRKDTRFWSINLKERNHMEDLGVGGKIILKWTSK